MRALLCAPWRAAKGLAAKMRGEGGTRPRGEAAAARGISNGAVPGLVENPWEQAALTPKYAALGQQDITTDVVVIGAGISGLSVAYNLVCAGKQVAVLEARTRGAGQTGRTTAHIMQWNDDFFHKMERIHGEEAMRQVAASHEGAVAFIEKVVRQESIDCDFGRLPGYLFPENDSIEAWHLVQREAEACKRLGLSAVEQVTLDGSAAVGGVTQCLRFGGGADFHPLRYIDGLARAVATRGGAIYELSRVSGWDSDGGVRTDGGGRVRAREAIVFATNSPVNRNPAVHARQEASRTYVIGLRLPRGAVPRANWWDTADPYHYVRITPAGDHDVLVVGGADHPVGMQEEKYYDAWGQLEAWARKRWTMAGPRLFYWSGEVYEPADGLGIYGPMPLDPANRDKVPLGGNVKHYVATGDSGQGMTGGTIAGIIISDQILGRHSPWAHAYSPSRLAPPLRDPGVVGAEVAHMARGYAEALLPRSTRDLKGIVDARGVERELVPGAGAVVQEGAHKVALFRDPGGRLHRLNAICPHLGCLLAWNPADKTFDCPCHGSCFDCLGRCIQGPALTDLEDLGDVLGPPAAEPAVAPQERRPQEPSGPA